MILITAEIVEIIKERLTPGMPVIEANPGPGLITRHLLGAGIQKLVIFESKLNPMPPIQKLVEDHPHIVTLIPSNIFEVYRPIAQDKLDEGDRFDTMMKPIVWKEWSDGEYNVRTCRNRPIDFLGTFHYTSLLK